MLPEHGGSAITCADFDYTLLPSVERLERIEDLPKLIIHSLKKKVDSKTLDEYVSFKEENTFEFDGTDFDIKYLQFFVRFFPLFSVFVLALTTFFYF